MALEESSAKAQNLGESWGMCSKYCHTTQVLVKHVNILVALTQNLMVPRLM